MSDASNQDDTGKKPAPQPELRRLQHDAVTLLGTIIGYSELLAEDAAATGDIKGSAELDRISSAGRKLRDIIEALFGQRSSESGFSKLIESAPFVPSVSASPAVVPAAVLIVDDEKVNRDLLTRRIRQEGHLVTTAENGREALEKARSQAFDLVLLDFMMPEMDGLEVLKQMKEDDTLRDIPVIIISAIDDIENIARFIALGAADYLPKPFNSLLLRSRINASLEQKRLRDREVMAHRLIAEANRQLEAANDNLLSILDGLQAGVVLTDSAGIVKFVSKRFGQLFDRPATELLERAWRDVFPVAEPDRESLQKMLSRPVSDRTKVAMVIQSQAGGRHTAEIEVLDDPRDPMARMFFVYDVTEVRDLRELLVEKNQLQGLIGQSAPMQALFQQIRNVASVDTTVLIEGETGTGKELVARATHALSRRSDRIFIPVNCAGLTESLLTSQLFGHKRGAFTGAISDQTGLFEAANGGTIFLDEIGDMPVSVQTQLLRVLQEREITRLGETRPRKIDVRIIAATHHDLNEAVNTGSFRQDLYYRIRVARLRLPALRERRDDIPLIAEWFLGQLRATMGKQGIDISRTAMTALVRHSWPGNVRELRAVIESAVIQCPRTSIQLEDLPDEFQAKGAVLDKASRHGDDIAGRPVFDDSMSERERLIAALDQAHGKRTLAAQLLGLSRATFYRRMNELGIGRE